jgi:colanic acid/amylovoran biosynthesis glycosyltransferase
MAEYPLGIFAPHIGAPSETFIRKHMEDLLPGHTAVVATTARAPYGQWNVNGPNLVLDQVEPAGLARRLFMASARCLGFPMSDYPSGLVKRFLQQCRVRVAVGEYLDLSLPWFRLCRELGIKFFAHAHGYDVSERLRDVKWRGEYLQYNDAGGVVTMSEVSRKRLVGLGLDPAKVHVIPYGVEVASEPLIRDPKRLVRCIAVGRMVAKKAPILTLDAFRRAAEARPELRLDYVGAGELLPAVRHFVSAFGLGEIVTLHRGQPNAVVRELMKAADIFLQHSVTDRESGDEEGCPVAVLEAMSHSLPVVATWHAGIPEAVIDGSTGYLVHEGNSIAMAERIVALAEDPGLRRRMGVTGWQRTKQHFSWKQEKMSLLTLFGFQPEGGLSSESCAA